MTISSDNYEEYLMLYADGELSEKEQEKLLAFLEANPMLKQELAAIEAVRMVADTNVVYAHKRDLLKEEKKAISILPIVRNIAATVLSIIFFASMFWLMERPKTLKTMASVVDTTEKKPDMLCTVQEPSQPAAVAANADASPLGMNKTALIDASTSTRPKLQGQKSITQLPMSTARQKENTNEQTAVTGDAMLSQLTPQTLTPAQVQKMELAVTKPMEMTTVEGDVAAEPDSSLNSNWIEKLPLDEVKKQKVAIAAKAIENGFDQLSNLKQNLRDKNVTIRIRAKKIIVSF